MANRCYNCDKHSWSGRRSKHHKGVAGASWKHKAQKSPKVYKVNLKQIRVYSDSEITRIKLCTGCLSIFKKRGTLKGDSTIHPLSTISYAPAVVATA